MANMSDNRRRKIIARQRKVRNAALRQAKADKRAQNAQKKSA